jgi:hypothetical protein
MTKRQSRGMVAHWEDPDVRERRRVAVEARRVRRALEERLAFLVDRRPPTDPEILALRLRIASFEETE